MSQNLCKRVIYTSPALNVTEDLVSSDIEDTSVTEPCPSTVVQDTYTQPYTTEALLPEQIGLRQLFKQVDRRFDDLNCGQVGTQEHRSPGHKGSLVVTGQNNLRLTDSDAPSLVEASIAMASSPTKGIQHGLGKLKSLSKYKDNRNARSTSPGAAADKSIFEVPDIHPRTSPLTPAAVKSKTAAPRASKSESKVTSKTRKSARSAPSKRTRKTSTDEKEPSCVSPAKKKTRTGANPEPRITDEPRSEASRVESAKRTGPEVTKKVTNTQLACTDETTNKGLPLDASTTRSMNSTHKRTDASPAVQEETVEDFEQQIIVYPAEHAYIRGTRLNSHAIVGPDPPHGETTRALIPADTNPPESKLLTNSVRKPAVVPWASSGPLIQGTTSLQIPQNTPKQRQALKERGRQSSVSSQKPGTRDVSDDMHSTEHATIEADKTGDISDRNKDAREETIGALSHLEDICSERLSRVPLEISRSQHALSNGNFTNTENLEDDIALVDESASTRLTFNKAKVPDCSLDEVNDVKLHKFGYAPENALLRSRPMTDAVVKIAPGKQELVTWPGGMRLQKSAPQYDSDPDKTLVNLDEDEDEDEDDQTDSEMDAATPLNRSGSSLSSGDEHGSAKGSSVSTAGSEPLAQLEPHYKTLLSSLVQVSHELVLHLRQEEEDLGKITADFDRKGQALINHMAGEHASSVAGIVSLANDQRKQLATEMNGVMYDVDSGSVPSGRASLDRGSFLAWEHEAQRLMRQYC